MKLHNLRATIRALALAAFCLLPSAFCHASLSAVVTPGYQFPTDGSVAPTYMLLNELAMPSVAIYGTIGGSNTLAPGSVTTVSFSASVVDGVTVGFNGNSPPGIQVLAAGVAGPGLTASTTTTLGLLTDTNWFVQVTNTPLNNYTSSTPMLTFKTNLTALVKIDTNTLAYATNSPDNTNSPALTNSVQIVLRQFTSSTVSLNYGLNLSANHLLGVTPSQLRAVCVCTNSEGGYSVGDEVPVDNFRLTVTSGEYPAFAVAANATRVTISFDSGGSPCNLLNTSGGGYTINPVNWNLKFYARP